MNASAASKPTASRLKALAPFIIGLGLLMLALKFGADFIEGKLHKPPSRSTLSISTQELLDRYNQAMSELDRGLLLPPANAMEGSGGNAKFHVLRHAVRPTIHVSTEVENTTSKPFSLGIYAVPQSASDGVAVLATQVAIGVAFYGKGDNAGALVKTCAKAADSKDNSVSIRIETFNVFCSVVNGMWIAGISVPD